ncbi:MAG: LTA synthase family protein [Allosphingosinicella sp.]
MGAGVRNADDEAPAGLKGSGHFALAWRLAAGGWIGCALLQLLLYLRPSPYGGPVLVQWKAFIIRPLVYELLAIWLFALPFFLLWLALYRVQLKSPRWRLAHWALAVLMAVNLLVTQFDHELYRFLGIRLGPSFLNIYAHPQTLGDSLFLNILRGDKGGPFLSPILCVAAPLLYLWWAARLIRRRAHSPPALRFGHRIAAAILLLPLATGLIGWSLATAKFRLSRLEPAAFAMIRDFTQTFEDHAPPGDVAAFARAWQAAWLAGSADRDWRFTDPARPFVRVPNDPRIPAADGRWNVVIVQLETVRGVDTGHLRPDRRPSATPYLDRLAGGAHAAVYTRALSFGPPSVNGRFATLCSLVPSSRRFVTSLTATRFYCLPDALRRIGYRAEMFSAGDIDMDNSTIWVQRMYDRLWRYPEIGQRDREIFRLAAERIRTLGRQGPFIATLITASNHHPFRSLEPALDIAPQTTVHDRIRNTSRYTDDVVRELVESLRGEPWFDRTLWVINSDHGYNLGEHDGIIGGYTLYRESVWTPFLIVGPHPRLPAGRHDELVTMLDIAPTIADLIGLREANPWQGHSLLALDGRRDVRFGFRDSLLFEAREWSAVRDPHDGRARLYRSGPDWLQRHNLAAQHPDLARRLLAQADFDRRMNDYLLRQDRIWRVPAEPDR